MADDESIPMVDMAAVEELERQADAKVDGRAGATWRPPAPPADWLVMHVVMHDKLDRLARDLRHTMNLVVVLCEIHRVTPQEIETAYEATRQAEAAIDAKGGE